MKKNKKAVSLIIVMWIVLVTWLLAITIIELIIPFSRSVSGMENSSKAYYLANAWVEEAMLNIKKNNENSSNSIQENNKFNFWWNLNSIFSERKLVVKWNEEPKSWEWDSEFSPDFNKISVWNPIQIDLSEVIATNFKIQFKVPQINWVNYRLKENNEVYINWQVSNEDWFINSTDKVWTFRVAGAIWRRENTVFNWNLVNSSREVYLSDFRWLNKDWNLVLYWSLWCNRTKKCILKFSVANELKWVFNGREVNLPYLEWKITAQTPYKLRYSTIESTWKSNNFVKKLEVKVPQATVNEAFDFTVFQ